MANTGIFYEDDFEMPFVKLLEEKDRHIHMGAKLHRKWTDPIIEIDLQEFLLAHSSVRKRQTMR